MALTGGRQKDAKSVTLYLTDETIAGINIFAETTIRSKSQAAEFLLRMGIERFDMGQLQPKVVPATKAKPVRAKKSMESTMSEEGKAAARKPAAKKRAPAKRRPRKTAA